MDEDDEEVVVESSRPLVVVALELDKRKDGGGGSASDGPVLLFKEFLLAYLSGMDAIVTSRGYDEANVDAALIGVS